MITLQKFVFSISILLHSTLLITQSVYYYNFKQSNFTWTLQQNQLIFKFELIYLNFITEFITTAFNIAYLIIEEQDSSQYKWLEYMITSSLMFASLLGLSQYQDLIGSIYFILINIVIMFTGWDFEKEQILYRQNEIDQNELGQYVQQKDTFKRGMMLATIQWGTFFIQFFTNSYLDKLPYFVYLSIFGYWVFYNSFALLFYLNRKFHLAYVELYYHLLSLTSKCFLSLIIFFGIVNRN